MKNYRALENNDIGSVQTSEICSSYMKWKIMLKNNEYIFDSYIKAIVILMKNILTFRENMAVICIRLKRLFSISDFS